MTTDSHLVHMEMTIVGLPEVVQIRKEFNTVQEVSAIVFEFIKKFAEPDAGAAQTITIVIVSRRDHA